MFKIHPILRKNRVAFDFGGTLIKIAAYNENVENTPSEKSIVKYIQRHKNMQTLELPQNPDNENKSWVHMTYFDDISEWMEVLQSCKFTEDGSKITLNMTGGGAFKYFKANSGYILPTSPDEVQYKLIDEIGAIANGSMFLVKDIPYVKYWNSKSKSVAEDKIRATFPKLVVNIGSGVSMIKCNDYNDFKRVSGTMISGSTLYGLSNLLYGPINYGEMLDKINKGDNGTVDILVKDIYGEDSGFEIPPDIVAGSLGKVPKIVKSQKVDKHDHNHEDKSKINGIKKNDVMKSLGFLIAANISHIAVLTSRLYKWEQILFTGNFCQQTMDKSSQSSPFNYEYLMHSLNFGVSFHGQSQLKWYFIEQGGFSGVLGALVHH